MLTCCLAPSVPASTIRPRCGSRSWTVHCLPSSTTTAPGDRSSTAPSGLTEEPRDRPAGPSSCLPAAGTCRCRASGATKGAAAEHGPPAGTGWPRPARRTSARPRPRPEAPASAPADPTAAAAATTSCPRPSRRCSRHRPTTVYRHPHARASSAAAANDSASGSLIRCSGRTSISQAPDRVTARKSGVCSRRFPPAPNRSRSGWDTTSARSPAKSRASRVLASSRLSNP